MSKATQFTVPSTGARFIRKGNGQCFRFGMPEAEQAQAIKRNGMAFYRISKREFDTAELFFSVFDKPKEGEKA